MAKVEIKSKEAKARAAMSGGKAKRKVRVVTTLCVFACMLFCERMYCVFGKLDHAVAPGCAS